jgi:hypothetical protein
MTYTDIAFGLVAGALLYAAGAWVYQRYTASKETEVSWTVTEDATGQPIIRYTCEKCGNIIEMPYETKWIGPFQINCPVKNIICNCENERPV